MVSATHNEMMAKRIKKERPDLERFIDDMNCITGLFWIDHKNYGKEAAWVNSAMNIIIPATRHPSKAFTFFDDNIRLLDRVIPHFKHPEHVIQLAKDFPPGSFPITAVSRGDIETHLMENDRMDLAVLVKHFTDTDMRTLACKMADGYLDSLYWAHIEVLPMEKLYKLREEHKCEHDSVPAICPDCSICGKCKKRYTCDSSTYDPQTEMPGPLEEPYNETQCDDLEEGDPVPKED